MNTEPDNKDRIKVILIDDEAVVRKATSQWLELAGFSVDVFADASSALSRIEPAANCVIVSDIRMPGMDGLEFAANCSAIDPDLPVILVTAHGDVRMAVQAIRNGAYDFIEKPYDPDLLVDRIQRAWEKRKLVLENRKLRRILDNGGSLEDRLLGESSAMREVRRQILKLAEVPVDLLIHGATGTGKERVARCLHDFSPRADAPFVAVNCSSIAEHLFESEFFGHEVGAFTGANELRIGWLESAQGGTLLLDDIESLPLAFQIKLLRVLQERKVERIGSNQAIELDVWVIATTRIDLSEAVAGDDFSEEFYSRFNVAELFLPRLVDRRGDAPLLFNHYAKKAACQYDQPYVPLDEEDDAVLMAYAWPGNMAELKDLAERYVLALGSDKQLQDLLGMGAEDASKGLTDHVHEVERQLIMQSLQHHNGNITAVMEALNLPRRTLNNKMLQYGIKRKDYLS